VCRVVLPFGTILPTPQGTLVPKIKKDILNCLVKKKVSVLPSG
jgi:hypothetical protein